MSYGVVYAYEDELLYVIHALEFAKEKEWDWILLERDPKYVVDLNNSKNHKFHGLYRAHWFLYFEFIAPILFKALHISHEGK